MAGLFPFLNPIVPQQDEPAIPATSSAIDGARQYSPLVESLLSSNPYLSDLSITDPTLDAANQVLAQRTQEVVATEETGRLLSELVKLDEREHTARTTLHKTLAEHQQFLAKNTSLLQAINQSHVLSMAGHSGHQQIQAAQYNGLAAARAAIANRMRGG